MRGKRLFRWWRPRACHKLLGMTIRPVTANDWPRIGELAERLVSLHHALSPTRFISPGTLPGDLYTSRVSAEIARGNATVYVADRDRQTVGFVYVGVEPESWKELRDVAGYIHDLFVDEAHRHAGIGGALAAAAVEWLEARGIVRIMLWTAAQNVDAQRLFQRAGFRPTMMEMMREQIKGVPSRLDC